MLGVCSGLVHHGQAPRLHRVHRERKKKKQALEEKESAFGTADLQQSPPLGSAAGAAAGAEAGAEARAEARAEAEVGRETRSPEILSPLRRDGSE